MFTGFVKSIPLEIEEAAMIDGCTPLQTFFRVVMPILKPTCITVAVSYTHLDVYKRQDTDGSARAVEYTYAFDDRALSFYTETAVARNCQKRCEGPVSYTHLDVYKRQEYI